MSSEALKESMARRVDEQCAQIAADAQAEADAIRQSARDQAAALREQTMKSVKDDIAQLRARSEQKARAEAARAELAMKNDAVEAVMEAVEERIRTIAGNDEFKSILEALLAELMTVAEGDVVLFAPPAHVDLVKGKLAEHGHGAVRVEAATALRDGVALQDPKRTYRVSNTLMTRYSRIAQDARKVCMGELFED